MISKPVGVLGVGLQRAGVAGGIGQAALTLHITAIDQLVDEPELGTDQHPLPAVVVLAVAHH
jgi:hypothetical protein